MSAADRDGNHTPTTGQLLLKCVFGQAPRSTDYYVYLREAQRWRDGHTFVSIGALGIGMRISSAYLWPAKVICPFEALVKACTLPRDTEFFQGTEGGMGGGEEALLGRRPTG